MDYPFSLIIIIYFTITLGIFMSFINHGLISFSSLLSFSNFNITKNYFYSTQSEYLYQYESSFYKSFFIDKEISNDFISTQKNFRLSSISNKISNNSTLSNKTKLSIAYALDTKYIYVTLVSLTSLLENSFSSTYYIIYLMLNYESFSEEEFKYFKKIEEKYYFNCSIFFLDLKTSFKSEKTGHVTTPTYYRLYLPELLPEINKILFLDCDTLIYKDLSQLFQINMFNSFVLGFPDSITNAIDKFGYKDSTALCAGVLLINLDKMRKENISEKFFEFLLQEKNKIDQEDQTVINVVCQRYLGIIPAKYGIWSFNRVEDGLRHNERQHSWNRYSEVELREAFRDPSIVHHVWPKPFWRMIGGNRWYYDWWEVANKTGYYNEIKNYSPNNVWK